MAGVFESLMKVAFMLFAFTSVVLAQESVQAAKGINVGMHAGIALVMCFAILGSCAIGTNILSKVCAKHLGHH